MEAFPNDNYVDGPNALEGAWSVSLVDSAESHGSITERVSDMARRSQDIGHIMEDADGYSSSDNEW